MNLIVKMIHGSHLYGTDDENSDIDYKGVYLPSKEDILLGRIKKNITFTTKQEIQNKNTPQDIDEEYFSIHEFIKLAVEGQTIALDMLHAPHKFILRTSYIWNILRNRRHLFYTKNLDAFLGYAKKQAAKYGVKGSRIREAKEFLKCLDSFGNRNDRLYDFWEILPTGEHISHIEDSKNGLRQIQVVGKIIQETVTIQYAYDIIHKYLETYGKRAELAAKNKGIDWKAISHAMRAGFQLKEIYEKGDITFPLKQAPFLRAVKQGKIDYPNVAGPMLDSLLDEVEELAKKSDYPEKVNPEVWDKKLIAILEYHYGLR